MSTKERITEAMGRLVSVHGYQNVTLKLLCLEADCPIGSFQHVMHQTFTEFRHGYETPENASSVITRRWLDAKSRKESIVRTAVDFAEQEGGLLNIGIPEVAEMAGVSSSTVRHYFHNVDGLREAVISCAVANGLTCIVAQAKALYPSRDLGGA